MIEDLFGLSPLELAPLLMMNKAVLMTDQSQKMAVCIDCGRRKHQIYHLRSIDVETRINGRRDIEVRAFLEGPLGTLFLGVASFLADEACGFWAF